MRNPMLICLGVLAFLFAINANADPHETNRTTTLSNNRVTVWKTVIYPGSEQILKQHRHDNDRLLVALSKGTLKIVSDKGKISYLNLKKGEVYYFPKDTPGELHTDENTGKHRIKVLVVELKH